MTTTPKIWKSLTQVNATDSGPDGVAQADGQIVALKDGGYVVIWADNSGAFNPNGTAVMGQRYNSVGNKVGGEVHLSTGFPGTVFRPAVTLLGDGNLAVAFVNEINGDNDIYVRIFSPSLTVGRTDFINTGATQTVDPSITALADGGYAVSYTVDDAQIAGRTVSISGFPGPQFGASGSTHSELATLSNGNFVVVHQGAAWYHRPRGLDFRAPVWRVWPVRVLAPIRTSRRSGMAALSSCGPTPRAPAATFGPRSSPTTPAFPTPTPSNFWSTRTRRDRRTRRVWWGWPTAASS